MIRIIIALVGMIFTGSALSGPADRSRERVELQRSLVEQVTGETAFLMPTMVWSEPRSGRGYRQRDHVQCLTSSMTRGPYAEPNSAGGRAHLVCNSEHACTPLLTGPRMFALTSGSVFPTLKVFWDYRVDKGFSRHLPTICTR